MRTFHIWCPDIGEEEKDAMVIKRPDEQSAVEVWAELRDWRTAEYSIAGGSECEVLVRNIDIGETSAWAVVGEAVPSYTARKVLVQHI